MFMLAIGVVIGVFVTGLVAHRWPQLFAQVEAKGVAVVNKVDDKVNAAVGSTSNTA